MILFLFLCIEYLNPKRLFAISSKVYSRINSNSLDLDTARCSNTLPRTSETTLKTIFFNWPFSYHNHQQKFTQCISLRGYITTYIYKLLVIPPKALLKCFSPNRSLFSKKFFGVFFAFFWEQSEVKKREDENCSLCLYFWQKHNSKWSTDCMSCTFVTLIWSLMHV